MQLPPLDDSFAKHVYVSRQHENAQEQSGLVKNLLVTMLPTCKVYLNEDDDDDDVDVEEQVNHARYRPPAISPLYCTLLITPVSRSRCTLAST